ncbi:MAG: Lanthionine biosynthesis protein LanM, partial [uncultured Corynebacteriales bacterium]
GVGWALSRYAAATGGRHRAAAAAALAADPLLTGPYGARPAQGWCSGLSGAVLAALDGGTPPAPGLDRAGAALAAAAPLQDMSLCHGELGVLEALSALTGPGHEAAAAARRRRAALLLDTLDRYGPQCGTPHAVPTPGLLSGVAGIGHGLLRLGFPDRVPAALLLAPDPGAG